MKYKKNQHKQKHNISKQLWKNAPKWARYVAIDPGGHVWFYRRRPIWDAGVQQWIPRTGTMATNQFKAKNAALIEKRSDHDDDTDDVGDAVTFPTWGRLDF